MNLYPVRLKKFNGSAQRGGKIRFFRKARRAQPCDVRTRMFHVARTFGRMLDL